MRMERTLETTSCASPIYLDGAPSISHRHEGFPPEGGTAVQTQLYQQRIPCFEQVVWSMCPVRNMVRGNVLRRSQDYA